MKTKIIEGLSQIQSKYNTFFIDLWGVVHNGINLFPNAIEVLENLYKLNKKFVLMSNAPRPSKNVKQFLKKLNMKEDFLKNIFTSGEAAQKTLQQNLYGKKFYHLGPERDSPIFEGFEKNKVNIDEADFILCTGLIENKENTLNYYKTLLKKKIKLKMVCTNPDLVVERGDRKEYCAGTLAQIFEKLGGEVVYFGKPYPEIYKFCIKSNESILVIGDNIRTDIRGANNMKLDSLFIINGIHKKEFYNLPTTKFDKILKKYKVKTNYYQERLTW
tara:strand:- start:503 stop:1321 length:819 start_codon:yes stop_codon:yes gene_type:complete